MSSRRVRNSSVILISWRFREPCQKRAPRSTATPNISSRQIAESPPGECAANSPCCRECVPGGAGRDRTGRQEKAPGIPGLRRSAPQDRRVANQKRRLRIRLESMRLALNLPDHAETQTSTTTASCARCCWLGGDRRPSTQRRQRPEALTKAETCSAVQRSACSGIGDRHGSESLIGMRRNR